jgi:PAP2 superfamily
MSSAGKLDVWRRTSMHSLRYQHRFHLWMAYACAGIIAISAVACRLTHTRLTLGDPMVALLVILGGLLPLPVYWHDRQRVDMREGALAIMWALVLIVILPFSVEAAARTGMPLQDANLARLDAAFGVSVPGMMKWTSHHLLGTLLNWSYVLLVPMLPVAIFVPGLAGKWKDARVFVVANMMAFAIGLVAFALFPAVGPWYGYHFAGTAPQIRCQSDLLLLRIPGPYSVDAVGIVCFPSFHVIWAILWARALWGFRFFRIPIALLSGVIVLSTMTTGWHYFSDVLAGAIVAILSLVAAGAVNAKAAPATEPEAGSDLSNVADGVVAATENA